MADQTCGLSVVNAMERASLDFWENYSETMLFFEHNVKQCLVREQGNYQNTQTERHSVERMHTSAKAAEVAKLLLLNKYSG